MSFYNSRYYKSSQKEQARHEGEHDAARKYQARIAELEQELEKANSRENQHRGCDIAGRACGSNCPYWAKYSDNIIDHHDPAKDLWKSV